MGHEHAAREEEIGVGPRKPRFLCLHGFRTSGEILKAQIHRWPESFLQRVDLVFPDGLFPAQGKSDVEGIYDPPYYEWFQYNQEYTVYKNLESCFEYIEDLIIKHGPIDGLMGFSQGAILSAALTGLQAKGMALKSAPKIKFLIIIGGAKFKTTWVAENAYSTPFSCPTLHFLGEKDFLKPNGLELLKSFVDPVVIHHPKGHAVPRIEEDKVPVLMNFLDKIEKTMSDSEDQQQKLSDHS